MPKSSKYNEAIRNLSPEQYRVTQQNDTEAPGTGEYLDNKEPGIYVDLVSASRCSPRLTNLTPGAGGPASPSPLNLRMSTNCGTPSTA